MSLPDGFFDVPPGKVAAIVTSLEMRSRPAIREVPAGPWRLRRVAEPDLGWYRDLYRRVGENWLWWTRLKMSDAELSHAIRSRAVEIFALESGGRDEGLLELDFGCPGSCELAFFGLTAPLVGKGAGRWLMSEAIARAWSRPISRFWVHTCTLDHPDAAAFYVRSGFRPFRRQVEIADDPRVAGILPGNAAPHIPIV